VRRQLILIALIAASCAEPERQVSRPVHGSMMVRDSAGSVLVNGPAQALACRRDSTLAVLAVGDRWAAAVSIRLVLPPDSVARLTIARDLNRIATAMVAIRSLDDSLIAWSGQSGTLRLTSGDSIHGEFESVVKRDSVEGGLSGRFTTIIPADRCP